MPEPSPKNLLLAVLSAAVLLAAAGCGVGSSDEGAVSEATATYLAALADGDYVGACTLMAEAPSRDAACAAELARAARAEPDGAFDDKVDEGGAIDVSGERAVVRFDDGRTLALTRESGEWRVASGYPR